MARNYCIFKDHIPIIQIVVNKSKLWFAESIGKLTPSPSSFLWTSSSSQASGINLKSAKHVSLPSWGFCGSKDALNKILMNSSSALIFFYGASKGNPRDSGAGGLVLSPGNLTKFSFSWGLGSLSNNQAKLYNLLMATQIDKEKRL